MVAFLIFLGTNISLTTVNAFNQAFDFTFLFEQALPEGCLKTSAVLENFKDNEVVFQGNNSLLSENQLSGYYLIDDMTRAASINEEEYYITTSYTSPVSSLGGEITVSDWENIYNVNVCVFKNDYTLCECIGGERTDPVFTVPYLIELGFIEEALQNIILESVTGMFTGGDSNSGGLLSGLFG
jgi:hypothetical protein